MLYDTFGEQMEDYKIYPKQFQFDKVIIEKKSCFMIMPFSSEFNSIYGIIKDELSKNGINCNRADEMNGTQPIVNKIIRGILKSRYIIVDLTYARPNVFYELGIAHSFRDAQNILLLKQPQTEYPFDITHLPYKEYDADNEFQLRAIVSKFIKDSKYISDFQDALTINDITNYTINESSNYIQYVQEYFGVEVDIYTHILNGVSSACKRQDLDIAFMKYEELIKEIIRQQKQEILAGAIQIYIRIIVKCDDMELSKKYALRFSDLLLLGGLENDNIRISYETDLMLDLANHNRLLDICLPWIIEYFARSKASSIDLNRYKLEHFLMNTENENINNIIVNSIYHENCHVREHMADIIGAKGIRKGFEALKRQLVNEENWYTISSIIEAIGRIAPSQAGMQVIEEWINENGERIIEEKQFFILKHLLHGIIRLEEGETSHSKCFQQKFGKYMYENKVGPID